MTPKEFRKNINLSEHKNTFNEFSVTIDYPHIDFDSLALKGLQSVYVFLINQNKDKNVSNLPSYLKNSKHHFKKIESQVLDIVNSTYNEHVIANKLVQIKKILISKDTDNRTKVITSNSPEFDFLKKLHIENSNYVSSAYNFLFNINSSINTIDSIKGSIKAYEFVYSINSGFSKRRTNEKAAISTIRNNFENYVSEREKEISELIDKSNDNLKSQSIDFENLVKSKETEFHEWYDKSTDKFNHFYENSKNNITEVEEVYQKKLMLEAPAKYWQKKSTKYHNDAKNIRLIVIWILLLTSIFLASLLIVSPDWIFDKVFGKDTATIIRWSVVFLVLVSLVAYVIKSLTKVMFSSYHLARDAEERHALTFFYLALLRDTEMKPEASQLILQSLFSRSDTGLLKDDSGPTMPTNDIINKVMKN